MPGFSTLLLARSPDTMGVSTSDIAFTVHDLRKSFGARTIFDGVEAVMVPPALAKVQ